MTTTTTCDCGSCRKCKHRAYMRNWYHRQGDAWRGRDYKAAGSGGKVIVECVGCGSKVETTQRTLERHGKRYCSRACKDRARCDAAIVAREQSKPERSCRHCGISMPKSMRSGAVYCSAECNSHAHQQTRKASSKIGARQKRIDRAYIIARDGGRCHLCGRKPRGAKLTIDHVVPLARGGTHTSENLRVACLSCNCSKGDRAANDQLMMVG